MKNLLVLTAAFAMASCKKKEEKQAPPPPPVAADAGGGSAAVTTPAVDPKVVERGAYLAKATGCLVCHTAVGPTGPDLANMGAGGLEMKEPLGTWRSPNITPDKASGIGGWTDDQIAAAIREGVRPDGTQLLAIMPFMNYNVMTDDDTKALVAFLRTLKPVERVVAKSDDFKMTMPPVGKPPNKAPTNDAENGAYMASLMLCNHCHWKPNKEGNAPAGPDTMFAGGFSMEAPPMMGTGVLVTPNITSDPDTGIGKWTEEQIFTTIKTMVRPDGKPIFGPMMFLQMGWSQLEDKDLKQVAAFIKKLPPVKNKVPKSTFKPAGPPPGAGGPPGAPHGGSGAPAAGSAAGSADATKK